MKLVSNVIVLVAWAILIAACGGGGGSSPPSPMLPPLSSDASLSSLSVSGGTLDPAFSPAVTSYTTTVPSSTNSVDVSATTSDGNASFTINGSTNATVALVVGDNTISIVVTAENGTGSSTYTIVVTRDVPPPPPPAAQSPSGAWGGPSVSVAAADVFEDFEFNATGGFSIGTSPYTADFSSGNAQTIGDTAFYISGTNSWHILNGTSATVTFETLPNTLTFHVIRENAAVMSEINIRDESGALLLNVVPTDVFQMVNVTGNTLIGSVEVTGAGGGNIVGGDVIIDDLTFGYSGSGFVGSTDDVLCLVADNREFICILADTAGNLLASAQGTMQVANTNQVSGSGMLYAVPGLVLADGKTVANLTISGGTVSEGITLNLTVEAAGTTSTVSTMFDPIYNRGSALANVTGVYDIFIFDDPSSFEIDATTGAIFGSSIAGCVLSGEVTPKNATFNEYDVALGVMDIGSCGVPDGMYVGLGLTLDFFVMNDVFIFAVFTTQSSVVGIALKQ